MNQYFTHNLLVLSVLFFFVSWGFTKAFLWAGVLLKGAVFFVSFSLFITLEQMGSIEMTVISLLGALTALGGGLTNGLYPLKDSLESGVYWIKEVLTFLISPLLWLLSRARQTLIIIISLFKSQLQTHSNRHENPQQRRKHAGGNNYNKGQKKEQIRKAREQFKQAREKEKQKEENKNKKQKKDQDQQEQGSTKPPQSTHNQDTRTSREILGLSQHFTQAELKKAYKIKASRFHPDKYAHMSQGFRSEAEQEFKKIQRVYKLLLFK